MPFIATIKFQPDLLPQGERKIAEPVGKASVFTSSLRLRDRIFKIGILALVLSGGLPGCTQTAYADETSSNGAANLSVIDIRNPQGSVDLPRLGRAIFRVQSSCFSLQVPVGFRENGKRTDTNNPVIQVWLLRSDGTVVPQAGEPADVIIGTFGDYSTDYRLYQFQKVPLNELAGVMMSLDGQLYCHEMESNNDDPAIVPPGDSLVQISPTNIFQSPLSLQVTNMDGFEHFTLFYKTDEAASGKFLNARQEISDGDDVISSEPVAAVWTTNGATFKFGGGNVWPFKFKIIETNHFHQTMMPGMSGYWFYLRDFATNASSAAYADRITKTSDGSVDDIKMPGLNEPIFLTEQPAQFTVQMNVATYRIVDFKHAPPFPNVNRQVWLLRSGGSSIPQPSKPMRGGFGNGGYGTAALTFVFPKSSTNEVAGIVVSVSGKLYCRELASDWNKP